MDIFTHIREALANLFTSKLRSLLAVLGILVGTGSVVALISSSQLATAHALAQFKTLGTNLLAMSIQNISQAQQSKQAQNFELQDEPILKEASKQIVTISPYTNLYENIDFHGTSFYGQILGADQSLATVAKIDIARGRFISYLDGTNYYCVIGDTLAKKIRTLGFDPLYQQLRLGSEIFTIVGIAKKWQPNLFLFVDINNGVIIPIRTSFLLSKYTSINDILFRLIEHPDLPLIQAQLTAKMKQLLPSKMIQFRNPEQIIQIVGKQRQTFTWLLTAIGGISLLVGGIGVMNIMLVSVVERRREIGIRMAIGAQRYDILLMFLIEAVILTIFGGIIGIIIGVAISYILAIVTKWQFYFYTLPPLLGFAVSVVVGIISGFYPALRASRLDPIQTLQSE